MSKRDMAVNYLFARFAPQVVTEAAKAEFQKTWSLFGGDSKAIIAHWLARIVYVVDGIGFSFRAADAMLKARGAKVSRICVRGEWADIPPVATALQRMAEQERLENGEYGCGDSFFADMPKGFRGGRNRREFAAAGGVRCAA